MTLPPSLPTFALRVADARDLAPLIRQITLRADDGRALPGYAAGAHIRVRVEMPGSGQTSGQSDSRHYSLVNLSPRKDASEHPTEYVLAVRREDGGRGGSLFMHRLQAGQTVTVEAPRNEFPWQAQNTSTSTGTGMAGTVLLAGGIGVTPLASMAAQCLAHGAPVRMVYAGRSRAALAYLPELHGLLGEALRVHADDEAGQPLNVDAVLDGCAAGEHLYVCGPKPLLDAVLDKTHARGWARERVHFEVFAAPAVAAGDHPFEVVLAQSGRSFTVPAGKSILDGLIEAGCDPLYDCQRGECGVCAAPVIEGEIDHRDYVLTEAEKAAGKVIHVCVSRCKGARLVLDM